MKICPNCGKRLRTDTKFCVQCGTDVRGVVPTDDVAQKNEAAKSQNETAKHSQKLVPHGGNAGEHSTSGLEDTETSTTGNSFTAVVRDYWNWLVNSWKAPFKTQDSNKYYGLATLAGENLVFVISVYIMINGLIRKTNDTANSVISALNGESSSASYFQEFGLTFFFKTLVFLLLATFLLAGAVYLLRKTFYVTDENFLPYLNRLASYTNLNVIFNVVIFLCAFMSTSFPGVTMIVIMISLIITMWMIGLYTMILSPVTAVKHDRIYGAFLLAIASGLIITVISYLGAGALLSDIRSIFDNLF